MVFRFAPIFYRFILFYFISLEVSLYIFNDLYIGTVLVFNDLYTRTVPVFSDLYTGTVPVFNELYTGTVPVLSLIHISEPTRPY